MTSSIPPDILGRTEMFSRNLPLDPKLEARTDQQIQSLGSKPKNIDISPYTPAEVEAFQQMSTQRISIRNLKNIPEITAEASKTHNFELPGKSNKAQVKSHGMLQQTRRELHKKEISNFCPEFAPREAHSQNLGFDFNGYGDDDSNFLTRTKLLESRRYELKIAEEDQKKRFIETEKENFTDQKQPFWQVDQSLHYEDKFTTDRDLPGTQERQNFHTFSCKEIENLKTYRNVQQLEQDNSNYKSLRIAKNQLEEARVNQPKIADPSTFDYSHINEQQPKKTKFATAVLMEKNPDWALLRVKSTMQQDEDKPLYSSFAPDGFFRELLLPQIRVPSRNCRQVPQQLRGMVRVMQLPIVAESTQLLDTEGDRMPGDTRILTRPSIFE